MAAVGWSVKVRSRRNSHTEAAIQYLTWALEEIEKAGHRKAAQHARIALDDLRGPPPRPSNETGSHT